MRVYIMIDRLSALRVRKKIGVKNSFIYVIIVWPAKQAAASERLQRLD
jgi:hypothetical protein